MFFQVVQQSLLQSDPVVLPQLPAPCLVGPNLVETEHSSTLFPSIRHFTEQGEGGAYGAKVLGQGMLSGESIRALHTNWSQDSKVAEVLATAVGSGFRRLRHCRQEHSHFELHHLPSRGREGLKVLHPLHREGSNQLAGNHYLSHHVVEG